MKIRITATLALGALLSTASAASAETAKDKSEEMVCKHQKRTDSRFTVKTCHTRAQWDAIAEQNKRDYAEQRDRPVIETRRE